MKVAAPAEFQARPSLRAKFCQVFLGGHRLEPPFPALGNEFLPHVGRIADDGLERRQVNGAGSSFIPQAMRQQAKGPSLDHFGRDFKEIAAPDARIVFLIVDVAGGQVQRGQMRGKNRDVHAVKLREPVLMRDG